MLINSEKRQIRTTYSNHYYRKYTNKIKGIKACRVNEIWVSDITYFKLKKDILYIHFITDVYSKKIVGYSVSERMRVEDILPSLKMAIKKVYPLKNSLIHHSDRGIQYYSKEYIEHLQSAKIDISMTENGDPLENLLSERINGIIKGEYLKLKKIKNLSEAKIELEKVIKLYNNKRPHMSCNYFTPNEIY